MGVSVRHVNLTASDGTPLEGFFTRPDAPKSIAFLVTHGVTGSYDTAVPGWFGREAASFGYATLALNRRDFGPNNWRTTFEDGLDDLARGVDFLFREGFPRIALCGHSKGTIYLHEYVVESSDARVAAVVMFSAVHDSALAAQDSYMLGTYGGNLALALSATAEGRERELMTFRSSFGPEIRLTAQGFLSYYGPLSLARPVESIKHARVPTLACWCSSDRYTPERYSLDIVNAGRAAGIPAEHLVIEDRDPQRDALDGHCFVGMESETMKHVVSWLERVL